MKMRHCLVVALPLIVSASMAFGVVASGSSSSAATSAASAIPLAPSHMQAQAEQEKPAPPAAGAPRTRDQILKEGAAAIQEHCIACHGPDKWEGTNRDRAGWAAIVSEMARQMAEAQMRMSDETANLIIDYLALTRPQ
jgi:mono/diheme cytochrome c family protein